LKSMIPKKPGISILGGGGGKKLKELENPSFVGKIKTIFLTFNNKKLSSFGPLFGRRDMDRL